MDEFEPCVARIITDDEIEMRLQLLLLLYYGAGAAGLYPEDS